MRKITAIFMTFLIISMPAVFAISIDIDSIDANAITENSARINWNTDVLGTGQVDIGLTATDLTTIPETGGFRTNHEVILSSLTPGTRYFYKVKSEEGNGMTSEAPFYEFQTLLAKPTNLRTGDLGQDSVAILWNSVNGAVTYRVYVNGVFNGETADTQLILSGLSEASTYEVYVSAIDAQFRESPASETLQFITEEIPIEITFIEVTGITQNSTTIRWQTDIAADSIVNYDTDIIFDNQETDSTVVTTHSITLINLLPGTTYYFTVESNGTESVRQSFRTLAIGEVAETIISNIRIEEITLDSAIIRWNTNIPATARVEYSMDDSFQQNRVGPDGSSEHAVMLDNLMSTTTYFFRVVSNDVTSPFESFTTIESVDDFLRLSQTPRVTRNAQIEVSGSSRVNSRIYIFLNENSNAQVKETINGTKFKFPVTLSSMANYDGIEGNNYVTVRAWDVNGNSDTESFFIVLDNIPPYLNIESDIPDMTKDDKLEIIGTSEKGAIIRFYLDGKHQGGIDELTEAKFTKSVNIGSTGEHILRIVAFDAIGNNNTYEKKIIVDRDSPEIEFVTDFQKTHFKLYKIAGTTEPGATVKVVNFGKYKGCEEAAVAIGYTKCEDFLEGQKTYIQADPLLMALGSVREETANENGEFIVTVALIPGEGNKVASNNLGIYVTDRAGNEKKYIKAVKYEPGCPDWHVGEIKTYPFNIYTKDINSGDIRGSAFFPITYLGTGVPTVTEVAVFKDSSIRGYTPFLNEPDDIGKIGENTLQVGMQNSNKYIELGNPKASKFDETKDAVFVYVPVIIKKYTGSIDALPDQMQAYLGVQITYDVPGIGKTVCKVYPTIAFDVQKPELMTKWLSPEQINRTIKSIEKMIEATEKILDVVEDATKLTIVACGLMVVWQYVKGFAGSDERTEDGCSEQQTDMKKVYWVCDRVLCPAAPPDCSDSLKKVDGQDYAWTFEDPKDKNKKTHIQMFYVDDNGKMKNLNEYSAIQYDKDGKKVVGYSQELDHRLRTCKGGTIVRYFTTDVDGKAGLIQGAVAGSELKQDCLPGQNLTQASELMKDSKNIKGCYNAACPRFDGTKCFNKADVNPPGGLWSSGRCLCLPGLQSHLRNYLKIMIGAKKCLQQALIGEVKGGFCERLLAQFICDLMTEVFRFIYHSIEADRDGGAGGLRGALGDFKENSQQVSDDLSDRYSGVVKDRLGLSTDQLVNKACVFAITGDWSIMDSIFEDFVDAVEIEPTAVIFAESRPYGYDPFTGKMSIGYNIYAGIVPGGETEIKLWLECDKNQPGGEYCGNEPNKIPITQVPAHMRKDDPPFNENIAYVDETALYWNNVVKMHLRYKVGEKYEEKEITKQIWRKGDLAYECTFSIVGGIHCEGLNFFSEGGVVELYPAGKGTRLSPAISTYYNGNIVAGLVTIRNEYKGEEFYLRIDYPGRSDKPIEYSIPGYSSAGVTNKGEQLYNVWLDNIGTVSASGETQTIEQFEVQIDEKLGELEDNFKYIWMKFENVDLDDSTNYFDVVVNFRGTSRQHLYHNKEERFTKDDLKTTAYRKFALNALKAAEDEGTQSVKPDFIDSITFNNLFLNTERKGGSPMVVLKLKENGKEIRKKIELTKTETEAKGTRKIQLNVLEDAAEDDNSGDTPILYNQGGDQKTILDVSYGSSTNKDKPKIDFIQPVGVYFNNDGPIPLGFNLWHPRNNIKEIEIQVVGKGDKEGTFNCVFTIKNKVPDNSQKGDCKGLKPGLRNFGFVDGKPPFFEYMLDLGTDSTKYSSYDVYIRAKGENEWSQRALKNFRVDMNSESSTAYNVMVTLGGSGMSCEKCIGYKTTDTKVAEYNASNVPTTTVRSG